MGRKKIDPRIRTLIENGVKTRHRTMIVMVGDKGKEQVINLHYILSKCTVKARPSVLWCYSKDLGFTTHRKKRMKEIKKQVQKGLRDPDEDDPFELFVASTDIRYTYYRESHKILGNTFGMCILQDFEALTPNLLARTIETVEGGGLIVFLLKSVNSLKQLYTLTMDVHSRFRTEAHSNVVGRFNERFILSLANCDNCIVVDDELNILPISSKVLNIKPVDHKNAQEERLESELNEIKQSVKDTEPLGSIISQTKSLDQAKSVLTFVEAISEKTLRSTVSLNASRGRGKSAALGLAIASAVAFGYSNIFVTSPSPENLKTLFEFICKGFDSIGYKEHMDYELIESTNPDYNKSIVRINIFRSHRQTIQYIHPDDHNKLGQAELVVIDEAAAIPLPIVKNIMGPYLVFMSSTINGYEGTGRSLSLKLISQLRQQSSGSTGGGRILREIEMKDPIRYAPGDPIEKWLNELLCLDATMVTKGIQQISGGYPSPSSCDLYYVSRDTLFSYHKASESFLQRMVSLYVSSHYKNSPDDLLLMSDAPAHHLFVLLGPIDQKNQNTLPEILCAIQVCLEGQISKSSVINSLSRGKASSGDLIPWTISQQFQDQDFPSLSGGRVVRIAVNPDYSRMGYGTRALELLTHYYQGEISSLSEDDEGMEDGNGGKINKNEEDDNNSSNSDMLHSEDIKPRKNLPPLLVPLKDRRSERLHYLGVSFGVTQQLFSFWKKSGYVPVYIRQTSNEITGEHTCIMIKSLKSDDLDISCSNDWLNLYSQDFKRRFTSLLGYSFRSSFPCSLGLSILNPVTKYDDTIPRLSKNELNMYLSPYDIKRLESYTRNLVDYHVITDIMPIISRLYFTDKLPIHLSAGQSAILLSIGLQMKSVDQTSDEMSVPVNQILALFNKAMRKISQHFDTINEKEVSLSLPKYGDSKSVSMEPLSETLDEELNKSEKVINSEMNKMKDDLLSDPDLKKFAIKGHDWDNVNKSALSSGSTISIKKNQQSNQSNQQSNQQQKKKTKRNDDDDGIDNPELIQKKKQHKKHSGKR